MEDSKKITKYKILVVDDNLKFLSEMKTMLSSEYDVTTATGAPEAMLIMTTQNFNLILLDYLMPDISGFEFLKILKRRDHREIPVIMLTGKSDSETIIQTMRAGATDFVIKGSDDFVASLKYRIEMALEKTTLVKQNKKLTEKIQLQSKDYEIIGASKQAIKLKLDILKLKGTSVNVLITGENGTGKELIARNLNLQEDDPSRPFIAVNCTAINPALFESEFFGHVKGAFTGANENKIGKFQAADGGDIFLDEIAELTPEIQAKFLRVIQEKKFTPVGSNVEISINVRIIAATNRVIDDEIEQETFREDLYHRIAQYSIHSPALRERKKDILLLADTFLKRKLPMFKFTEETQKALLNYSWSGNIRELEYMINRAAVEAKDASRPFITAKHLILKNSKPRPTKKSIFVPEELLPKTNAEFSSDGLESCLKWMERTYIENCLNLSGNDNKAVYTKFKISKSAFFKRKKSLGISTDQEAPL